MLNAAPGKDQGKMLIHRSREGENLFERKSADGRLFIQEMLTAKQGSMTYDWPDVDGNEPDAPQGV